MAVTVSWVCVGLTRGSLLQKDQFGMYALYSKNKPKSDSLLASHGNTFFKVNSTAYIMIALGVWVTDLFKQAQLSCLRRAQHYLCFPGTALRTSVCGGTGAEML